MLNQQQQIAVTFACSVIMLVYVLIARIAMWAGKPLRGMFRFSRKDKFAAAMVCITISLLSLQFSLPSDPRHGVWFTLNVATWVVVVLILIVLLITPTSKADDEAYKAMFVGQLGKKGHNLFRINYIIGVVLLVAGTLLVILYPSVHLFYILAMIGLAILVLNSTGSWVYVHFKSNGEMKR